MGERAPYSRVYWSIVDDPKFAVIYDNDRHLSTWLRLLIAADAIWPASPSLPVNAKKASITALVDAGLLDLIPGHRSRIHGLDAERSRRSRSKDEDTNKSPDGDQQPTNKSPDGPSRAGAPRLGSSLLVSANGVEGYGEAGPDALVAYHSLTGRFPTGNVKDWLDRLVDEHGDQDVEKALGAEMVADRSLQTLLSRTENRLALESHEAEKRAAAAKIKADEEERRRIQSMPEEQRAANLARLGEMMAEKGLLPRPDGKPA
jgi:hypothetical protein